MTTEWLQDETVAELGFMRAEIEEVAWVTFVEGPKYPRDLVLPHGDITPPRRFSLVAVERFGEPRTADAPQVLNSSEHCEASGRRWNRGRRIGEAKNLVLAGTARIHDKPDHRPNTVMLQSDS